MVTTAEATSIILSNLFRPDIESVDLAQAAGRVLAEEVRADRDFPPYNRSAMDGIAISHHRFESGQRDFVVEAMQAAGEKQKTLSDAAHCIEIMTGAVLPANADTVVRYEDIEITNGVARIADESIKKSQHVHRQGQDATRGEILLVPGIIISPAEVALLASVGKSETKVFLYPRAAVISSGDELVEITATPESHQIRRSNTYAIQAGMRMLQWNADQFHLPDDEDILKTSLGKIKTDYDVIILSGGISKGKFDFIPKVLEEVGIKKLFHQVSQRPGKPFWFGASPEGKIVFALPGNPVSTYMCFYRYIEPWFWKSLGVQRKQSFAALAEDFTFQPKLGYFLQVRIENENGRLVAYPDAGGGSGDFANLKKVNGFLELPMEQSTFAAGDVFPYFPFRH